RSGSSRLASVERRVLPGFSLSLGYPLFYMSLPVLLPIVACLLKASTLTLAQFWDAVWTGRTRAAYGLTFGASLASAAIDLPLGLLLAWVLARYSFPRRRLLDAVVDLPLGLP